MKLFSLIYDDIDLIPIEVEVKLIPGAHSFSFIGSADKVIKESEFKIRSAFKHCGFQLPHTKEVIINMRPNLGKKISRGMDLLIALAILWETGQLEKPDLEQLLIYGELSLTGEIFIPNDLMDLLELPYGFSSLLTGKSKSLKLGFVSQRIEHLSLANQWQEYPEEDMSQSLIEPEIDDILINENLAKVISAIAIGEHHCLIAGPKGTGKTTIVHQLNGLIKSPNLDSFRKSLKIANYFGDEINWRPFISPHHTSTHLAMVGGGVNASPGEITRAHGGILLMDEYLEFPSSVQESLREPMEKGKIFISRVGKRKEYPADFILLATTNLCPCGNFSPTKMSACVCRYQQRRRYLERISGPVLDRFTLMLYSDDWRKNQNIKISDMKKNIKKAQLFSEQWQSPVNQKLNLNFIIKRIEDPILLDMYKDERLSHRRWQSFLRLAASFADLSLSEMINAQHLKNAYQYSVHNFKKVENSLLNEC